MNLLMISGDRTLASGKSGAFFNTLQELRKHFDRIDVICPKGSSARYNMSVFDTVFIHPSPWPLVFQWLWIWHKGRMLVQSSGSSSENCAMTVHEYPPFYNGIGAWLLHRATGMPYMLEIMHIPGVPRASGMRERLYRLFTRWCIALDAAPATTVRVINKHETPELLAAYGVPREKLQYIPAFYVDLEIFRPEPEIEKVYDLIFVGRLVRNKGIGLFLDVVRLTKLRALVVGEGPLLEYAIQRTNHENLRVDFCGFAKDATEVAHRINQSRLLAMTSFSEGGPRVVLEAMACGVPVVATPVGIVRDVAPPECIEEWNGQDFSAKVNNLLSDAELYARIRETGIHTAQQFERRTAIVAYVDALKLLIKS